MLCLHFHLHYFPKCAQWLNYFSLPIPLLVCFLLLNVPAFLHPTNTWPTPNYTSTCNSCHYIIFDLFFQLSFSLMSASYFLESTLLFKGFLNSVIINIQRSFSFGYNNSRIHRFSTLLIAHHDELRFNSHHQFQPSTHLPPFWQPPVCSLYLRVWFILSLLFFVSLFCFLNPTHEWNYMVTGFLWLFHLALYRLDSSML